MSIVNIHIIYNKIYFVTKILKVYFTKIRFELNKHTYRCVLAYHIDIGSYNRLYVLGPVVINMLQSRVVIVEVENLDKIVFS